MTPTLIIDCSMTMSWCFADEATANSNEVQERLVAESALVPSHWFLEVVNMLLMAERRKRISNADSTRFVNLLSAFDIQSDDEGILYAFDRLPQLCRSHSLTSYDAAYLELAIRRRLPLASLDEELRQAATSLGVEVLGQ